MSSTQVSCRLSAATMVLVLVLAGCNRFDECNSDNDCGAGFKCVKGESAGVVSAACVPTNAPEDVLALPELIEDIGVELPLTCGYTCSDEVQGNSACDESGKVCYLDCGEELDDCDNVLANGCEIDLKTPDNCGGCGIECVPELAKRGAWGVCEALKCTPRGCLSDWIDIGADLSDGCSFKVAQAAETDLLQNYVGHIARANPELLFAERKINSNLHEIMAIAAAPTDVVSLTVDRGGSTNSLSNLRHALHSDGETHLLAVLAGNRPSFLTYTNVGDFVEHDVDGLGSSSTAKPLSVAVSRAPDARPEVEGEFFSLDNDGVLRWYSLQPDVFVPDIFGCGATQSDNLKICLTGETLLAPYAQGGGAPVAINTGMGPSGVPIVWVSFETGFAEFLLVFNPASGDMDLMQVAGNSVAPQFKALEIEPISNGATASFAVLSEAGVEFFYYLQGAQVERKSAGKFEFAFPSTRSVNDLVVMDDGQFVLVTNDGLYFFSDLDGTDLFQFDLNTINANDWLYGAYADGMLDVVRHQIIYHFELQPPAAE